MVLSLSKSELLRYVQAQTRTFFPDGYDLRGGDVEIAFRTALERTECCIDAISVGNYHNAEGNCTFSHLHADQYATFLYFLANSLWAQSQNKPLCDKLLQLNRLLASIFISYKCNMPDHFLLLHPMGTMLGNAEYGDFLVVFHGVTVGTTGRGDISTFGRGVLLGAHAQVIGRQRIGNRVSIGVNAVVYQREIPDDGVVTVRGGGALVVGTRKQGSCKAQQYFSVPL